MSTIKVKPETPTCANCGAKFSFNSALQQCNKCGILAEIVAMGTDAIRDWRKIQLKADGKSKHEIKMAVRGGRQRSRNKHGRKGIK